MLNPDNNPFRSYNLTDLGWDSFFNEYFESLKISDCCPARVSSVSRDIFRVLSPYGELIAGVSGKMRYESDLENQNIAVGDWVAVKTLLEERKAVIRNLLPRKSKFSRKVAGERTEEQIVSANVDTVFIVSGLDGGRSLNLRRIERYLTLAWNSGAVPVIVLNKVDLCPDVDSHLRNLQSIAPGIDILSVSAKNQIGLDTLQRYLSKGKTAAFLGSSGVGKSALINCLIGMERQKTGAVRQDDHLGRHTTTMRQLFLLPQGGLVIDTPGMREIQMWGDEDDLQAAFSDIETLSKKCRYRDCSHHVETGCAVRTAVENGELDSSRLESYHKLQGEMKYLAFREENSARLYEKQKWKKVAKWAKEINNNR
jgi:ribosome biogenesis GTPase / thiamine phosphate phosphatase